MHILVLHEDGAKSPFDLGKGFLRTVWPTGNERGWDYTSQVSSSVAAVSAPAIGDFLRAEALCDWSGERAHMMLTATVLTDRFDRALLYATHVHGGQVRKETTIPYIAHLLAVTATVLEYGGSEDMAIAGLLHDAAEDQGGKPRLADIRNRFGDRVADIVHACSDSVVNTAAGQQKEDWRTRKMRYIEHLKTVDRETCLVSLSDKVHNARSILRDLRKPEIGTAVWSRFGKRPKEDTLWYYRELANAFRGLLPGQLADELMEIVIVLENE